MIGQPSVFVWLRLRLLRNRLRGLWRRPARPAAALLLAAVLWGGLYASFQLGFDALYRHYGDLFVLVLSVLFATFFFIVFVLLVFSSAIVNYSSLFRSWEAVFFRAAPVAPGRVFWHKAADAVGYALWALALLGLPIVVAFGRSIAAGATYYVLAAAALSAFALLSASLGAALTLLFVRFVLPARRRILILAAAAGLAIAFLSAGELLRQHTQTDAPLAHIASWIQGPLARVNMARNPFLPSAWLSEILASAAQGNADEARFPLALLMGNALFFGMIAWRLADAFYGTAFFVAHGGRRSGRRRGKAFYRAAEFLLPTASTFKRLLIVKDLKVFLRTPAQWGQALILGGILVVYFANIRHIHTAGTGVFSREMCAFLNFVASAMTVCTLMVRFAFPMISLEGLNFWVLGTLPVERRAIMEAKFLAAVLASFLVGAGLVLVSDLALGVSSHLLILHLIGVAVLALGLGSLTIGLGILYPSFQEPSPSKIASGFGGTVNLVLSIAFCAFVLAFLVMPFHLDGRRLHPPFDMIWAYRDYLGITVVALTAAIFVGMGRLGLRALEALEP